MLYTGSSMSPNVDMMEDTLKPSFGESPRRTARKRAAVEVSGMAVSLSQTRLLKIGSFRGPEGRSATEGTFTSCAV